eukprot:XP_001699427.1 predicted protein [Chlamydomonas reinhardtii]
MSNRLRLLLLGPIALCYLNSRRVEGIPVERGTFDGIRMSPPIDFAVLGGSKCGTSALWKYSTTNPALAWVGEFKENEYWANQIGKSSLCDNVEYLTLAATQRRVALQQRPGQAVIVGDWASANLQCLCCAVSLKTINPDLKVRPSPLAAWQLDGAWDYWAGAGCPSRLAANLVVVLRDPVQRALSVFLSAKRAAGTWWNEWTKNHTLASYVDMELASLRRCVQVARRFRTSNQLLVLYASQLATQPAAAVAQLEAFLGVPPGNYSRLGAAAAVAAGTAAQGSSSMRDCLGWHCALKSEPKPTADGFSETGSSAITAASSTTGGRSAASSSPFARAVAALAEFYAPHVARLVRWGREGRISPPPQEWREAYGLDRHRHR